MSKHTSGSWRAVIRSNQNGPQMVAVDMPPRGAWGPLSRTRFSQEDVDTARLIAAAPDMLEALMAAAQWVETRTEVHPADAWDKVRAAIAKAEGRS